MKNEDKYIDELLNGFQRKRGKGSSFLLNINKGKLVYEILKRFNNKHETDNKIFIVVDEYLTRKEIVDYLYKENPKYKEEYNIVILSRQYVDYKYNPRASFIITIGINNDYGFISSLNNKARFMLALFTKNELDNNFILNCRSILPDISTTVQNSDILYNKIYNAVNANIVGVDFNEEDKNTYNKYSKFINDTISIFGNLDILEKCRIGDSINNISAAEYRDLIAKNNGWSTELDTTIDYYKEIDEIFNPNSLLERATNIYNITRCRRDLCTDNIEKLKYIKQICDDNPNSKILIVSKRGEFAAEITKYLNEEKEVCGDYHDCIKDMIAADKYGNIIYYKTGKNKGQPKVIKSKAISSLNENLFNNNKIRMLSIKTASNTELKIAIDIIIFTTPLDADIFDFIKRYNNITINSAPYNVYYLYMYGSIEEKRLPQNNSYITINRVNEKIQISTENFD